LLNKGTIVLMADNVASNTISPNIFHLCSKVKSKMVFYFAELKTNGIVETFLVNAPNPYCENEVAIMENIDFFLCRLCDHSSPYYENPQPSSHFLTQKISCYYLFPYFNLYIVAILLFLNSTSK
jgi:hypothetical protein